VVREGEAARRLSIPCKYFLPRNPLQKGERNVQCRNHEPIELLSVKTWDMHRAIVSLMEELEAIDWYNQCADACTDSELKAILEHNRDEEKEHASMVLKWIRRNDPKFSSELKDYLFTEKPIAEK
jgi:ferritin-like protein